MTCGETAVGECEAGIADIAKAFLKILADAIEPCHLGDELPAGQDAFGKLAALGRGELPCADCSRA